MASVFFAVVLSTLMMSIKEGVYAGMIDSVVGAYMGYGQVHAKGYWDERTLDYSFEANDTLLKKINQVKGVRSSLQRVESVAMVATEEQTKVAMVVGIDVDGEKNINQLNMRVFEGSYLKPGDKAVMLGDGLAAYLKVKVNDTIVLLGQGYHGSSAAGKYPVQAIVKFGSPELSKQLVFLPIREAQWLYNMDGIINNIILYFDNNRHFDHVVQSLQNILGDAFEVMPWQQTMPDLDNLIKTDRVEGYVFMFILYMVVSFGILGTILMMMAERTREFGVLVAVGMKRVKLAWMIQLEVILISIMGAVLGMAAAWPVCYYFFVKPIELGDDLKKMTEEYGMEAVLRASVDPYIFIQQGVVIFLIACVISLYPFFKLVRMSAIKSLRG